MQKALDDIKRHCEALGCDYNAIEKTSLCTVNLSAKDTVSSIVSQIKQLSQMGFTHTIFNMPDAYSMTSLKTFGKEIIPAVAEL